MDASAPMPVQSIPETVSWLKIVFFVQQSVLKVWSVCQTPFSIVLDLKCATATSRGADAELRSTLISSLWQTLFGSLLDGKFGNFQLDDLGTSKGEAVIQGLWHESAAVSIFIEIAQLRRDEIREARLHSLAEDIQDL